MNINYFSLFLKGIVFALIVLALKSCCNGIANAAVFKPEKSSSILKEARKELRSYERENRDRPCKITTGDIWIDFWGRYHDGDGVCRFYNPDPTPIIDVYILNK